MFGGFFNHHPNAQVMRVQEPPTYSFVNNVDEEEKMMDVDDN